MTPEQVMARACELARAALEADSRPGENEIGPCEMCGGTATWVDLKIQSNDIVIVTRPRCEAHK